MIDGFKNGFKLGMTRRPDPRGPCLNSREVRQNPEIAQELVDKEIAVGHILGPFDTEAPPLPNLVYSPINIVPKPGTNKYRLVHDLSYPRSGNQSINSCIPEENSSVQYSYIEDVIDMAIQLGPGIWGGRIDILHAFRNARMHPSEIPYLAFSLKGKTFLNVALAFGAASSCAIFERISHCLEWIVSNETNCKWISHFLDNFPLLHKSREGLKNFMNEFYRIMSEIGMPVAIEKTLGPTQVLEYLGLLLDFINQTIGIPEKKRIKSLHMVEYLIAAHKDRKNVTVKKLQQTAGTLNFIIQALPAGRPFIMCLYRLARKKNGERDRPGNHRKITREVVDDMKMIWEWLQECAHQQVKTVPFLNRNPVFYSDIELYSDAAGHPDLGVGIYFRGDWRQGLWCETSIFKNNYRPNIALLELYAAVIAVEVWKEQLQGHSIILQTDNKATEAFINTMKADIPACSDLLRFVAKTCLHFQIRLRAVWVQGEKNVHSDRISRNQMEEFFQLTPVAPRVTPPLPQSIWPPTWTVEAMTRYPR